MSQRLPVDGLGDHDDVATDREQTRARYPDSDGVVERDGVRVFYEVYGTGAPTFLLLPTWSVVHSRCWKMQIPYLARHGRVVSFDGRGNGHSDRPTSPEAYAEPEFAADALAVLDATATPAAVVVSWSLGAQRALLLAAEHPERVERLVFIAPAVPAGTQTERAQALASFETRRETYEGWEKYNRHHWEADYRDFLDFFFSQVHSEPHSTKPIEDGVGWGLETAPQTLAATVTAPAVDEPQMRDLASRVRCPTLVIHGTEDMVRAYESGALLADLCHGTLLTVEGGGHATHVRQPVAVNLALRDFAAARAVTRRWTTGTRRRRRALYVSSPIGLGHARRDVAIADELRRLHPDLEIDWLAQHPVTAVLEARGERIHPASAQLASEAGHIESESSGHDLHCFQAVRRMDEILVSNYMVFHDLVREHDYDLWIGDEAWELDHFLHENPEHKRAAYAWLTDFVGWLPMPEGGDREVAVTADYNAQMIEQIARYPRVRDRAIFVGNEPDIVGAGFGPGLPAIRDWTAAHYSFSGYVTGFDADEVADRERLRAALGYAPDERVCIVTVGGSGVGRHLLRRVIDAYPEAAARVRGLRMIAVTGPRIDPEGLGAHPGVEIRAYVDDLYRHLAACDLAVVQGGLATAMELTANRRPFLYFPLRRHFEQVFHVHHRLQRYGAGRCMRFDDETPSTIAAAIAEEIDRDVDCLPVERDGAARAASLIAELV